jgi:GNAT superfamily N-acetyltransferase
MSISIRPAAAGDGGILHAMVRELAVSHGHVQDFTAAPEDYERFLADPHAINGALIGFWQGEAAGCAIWQRSYSTFRGRETLYLEDLSVLPQFRRLGLGRELVRAVARLALSRNLSAVTWLLMSWNVGARRLYTAAGAEIEDGNCLCRLSGAALERLASERAGS